MSRTSAPLFTRFAKRTASLSGSSGAFILAVTVVVIWGVTGPLFKFSDTWQLVINTGTTIITFLMVFLIQNTQNRDTSAMQLKLDELICAVSGAHEALLDLEELEDKDLEVFRKTFKEIAEQARRGGLGSVKRRIASAATTEGHSESQGVAQR